MTVLQTIALPLGYSAVRLARGASDYVLAGRVSIPGIEEIDIRRCGGADEGGDVLLIKHDTGVGPCALSSRVAHQFIWRCSGFVVKQWKLGSIPGHSANALKWQVCMALMVYVLLRYRAHLSE